MLNRKKNYDEMSYGELVAERISLQDEILEFEIYENKGAHLNVEFPDIPMTIEEYREKLMELSELNMYMAKRYTPETIMVDVSNPDSVNSFARGTFWFEYQDDEIDINNAEAALELLEKYSNEGNAESQNILGALYYEGVYVNQDYEKAAQYYIAAARNGHSLAMSNAGYCYFYGNGVEQSYAEAFKYFSKAVMFDEYDAANMIGDMYRDGLFVQQDRKMAYSIYKTAYDKMNHMIFEDAYGSNMMRLGICYLNGYGCEKNVELAEDILNEAKEIFELQIDYGRGFYAEPGLKETEKLLRNIHPKNDVKKELIA